MLDIIDYTILGFTTCKLQLNTKIIRPIRVAAKKQRELMAITAHSENAEMLSAEWIDEEDVDLSGIIVPQYDCNEKSVAMPIFSIEEHLASPWEDDSTVTAKP